jgi:hypothetical protein
MTGHLMPDRIDGTDVIDEWKVRRDMALEELATQEKEKSTAATVDK